MGKANCARSDLAGRLNTFYFRKLSLTIEQLIHLQNKYAVIVFRKTGLDNARHIAFSQQLGDKLEINPFFYGRENDRLKEPLLFDVGK